MDIQICLLCQGTGETIRMDGDYRYVEERCRYCHGQGYEKMFWGIVAKKKMPPMNHKLVLQKAIEAVENHLAKRVKRD